MNKSYEDLERLISECKLMLNKRDEEIEALKAERDALAAQVRSLQKEKLDLLVYVADSEKWFNKHDPNSYVSPKRDSAQQCLRDIQAEAGRAGFIECATRWNFCNAFGEFVSPEEIEAVANEYAESVRQGTA